MAGDEEREVVTHRPQKNRQGGKIEILSASTSENFISLSLGRPGIQKLLHTTNTSILKWLQRNSCTVEQAVQVQSHIDARNSPEPESASARAQLGAEKDDETRSYVPDIAVVDSITQPIVRLGVCQTASQDKHGPRPKIRFKTGFKPSTPAPQSAIRLSIKLGPSDRNGSVASPALSDNGSISGKKRKRSMASTTPDLAGTSVTPAAVIANGGNKSKSMPKLSLKVGNKIANTPAALKLKTKGRVPKRPLGVGYDSELEDREVDPVILEAFVLRMQSGDDCEYVRKAIQDGTIGTSVLQGGPSISLRFFDTNGRRGVLRVRNHSYAVSLVDLPTITEGMKSWDRKNFMKSVDISQICLVIGRVNNDEEAKTHPLPADINQRNYQYAHGLTAPMKWVRKRRFERTARAKVADIETWERKLDQLLQAEATAAEPVKWEITSSDPRLKGESESEIEDEDEEEDEDEDDETDAEGEEDDYFNQHELQAPQYDETELADIDALFDSATKPANATAVTAGMLGGGLDSGVVTPNAPNLSADTPGDSSNVDMEDAEDDDDGPEDNDDNGGHDEDDEEEEEANSEKQEGLLKIKEKQNTIAGLQANLKTIANIILKKKAVAKIKALENDIDMLRRKHGFVEGGASGADESEEE